MNAVCRRVGHNREAVQQLGNAVDGMHVDWYGHGYENKPAYLNVRMRDQAIAMAQQAMEAGTLQRATRQRSRSRKKSVKSLGSSFGGDGCFHRSFDRSFGKSF